MLRARVQGRSSAGLRRLYRAHAASGTADSSSGGSERPPFSGKGHAPLEGVWRIDGRRGKPKRAKPPPPSMLDQKLVPEGFPRGPSVRFDAIGASFRPRESDAALASVMDSSSTVIVDGPRGTGKSSALLAAVLSARAAGGVVMYIPSARQWTHGDGFFTAVPVEGHSPVLEGMAAIRYFDRPKQTAHLLNGLLDAHADTLGGIRCSVDAPLRDVAGRDLATVRDVVAYGVDALRDIDSDWRLNPRRGGDALDLAVRELSAQAHVPFMLAIDDYDSFLGLTSLVSERKRCVHAGSIRAVATIFGRSAIGSTATAIKCGVVVGAVSKSHGAPTWRKSRVESTIDFPVSEDIRRDPTGKAWLEQARRFCGILEARGDSGPCDTASLLDCDLELDPTAVSAASFAASGARFFDVPEWTHAEASLIISDFAREGKLDEVEVTERKRLLAIAGGRADVLHKLCMAA